MRSHPLATDPEPSGHAADSAVPWASLPGPPLVLSGRLPTAESGGVVGSSILTGQARFPRPRVVNGVGP
jgi:hypothetical protein